MTVWRLFCVLTGVILLNLAIEAHADVMIIEKQSGKAVLTNVPGEASGSRQIKMLDKKAECYVFPLVGRNRKPALRAEKILTGIFSGKNEIQVLSDGKDLPVEVDHIEVSQKKRTTSQDENTIAWITKEGLLYHDPFLECATGSERVWVSSVKDLCGLQPCEECFKKNNHTPDFIVKESGGLDLASAAMLLNNADFLTWAQEHLPIRNPGLISSQKLLIYAKMEMTDNGLQQLARETELAYRRHTWKIIEVIGKKSETDTGSVSSFEDVKEGDD